MKKILSVCIPTYNMEALLSRCLDSFIIEQNLMEQLEIIVVNDGSKDSSSKIAHEYAEKYPGTYIVVDKTNGNYGSCINAALKVATGKYFRICDADDCYDSAALSKYVEELQKTDADLTITPFVERNFNDVERYRQIMDQDINGKLFIIEDIRWTEWKYLQFRAMHCLAVKTHLLVDNHYKQLEGISYTDTQFVFFSTLYSNTCVFLDLPLYHYYLGRDGQTMSKESMARCNLHFYKNAKAMLDKYVTLPKDMPENKRYLIFNSITVAMGYFSNLILLEMKHTSEQQALLRDAIKTSKESKLYCPLEEVLSESKYFKYWYRYHVPQSLIYTIHHRLH